jgi:hypothetical protein
MPDVLIVSLGSTHGLRTADAQLAEAIEEAGATAAVAAARAPRPLRTLAATDLAWALAARRAARDALASGPRPRAIVYSSTTAALLWPAPGAVRFDAPAAGNRPGRHGFWQRPLERRRLGTGTLLLPWSEGAIAELGPRRSETDTLVLPVAVESSGPAAQRDIAVLTYAANPSKKGLDRLLAAWGRLRPGRPADEELLVAGTSEAECAAAGVDVHVPGVRLLGPQSSGDYRALVRRARVFACAPRREDYGIAQLEALVDGAQLVTTPAPGPYAALPIARELDARLVTGDLAPALRAALDEPRADYAERAALALEPYGMPALRRRVADGLLPRLLAPGTQLP